MEVKIDFVDESQRGTGSFPSGKFPSLSRRQLLELGHKWQIWVGLVHNLWSSFKLVTTDISES